MSEVTVSDERVTVTPYVPLCEGVGTPSSHTSPLPASPSGDVQLNETSMPSTGEPTTAPSVTSAPYTTEKPFSDEMLTDAGSSAQTG